MFPLPSPLLTVAAAAGGGGGGGSGVTSVGTILETGVRPGSIPLPTYAAGDVVFFQVFKADAGGHAGSTTPPSGWTLASNINAIANTISHQVFYKVMTGSEGTSVSHDWVTSGSVNAQALTVSGVNTGGAIIEGAATNSGQSGTSPGVSFSTAAVTTLGTNRLILNFFGTARGTDGTMAGSVDSWTDIAGFGVITSSQSLKPHTVASKQVAATAQSYTAETRTENNASAGDLLWSTISFAIPML